MHALLLIDLQNDFLPGGALAVPDGDAVIAVANQLMDVFDKVVATQDFHPANHGSFASQHKDIKVGDLFDLNGLQQVAWPDHCLQGSLGADFASDLHARRIDHVSQKGLNPEIDSYSGFFDNGHQNATDLHNYLQSQSISHLTIMGLATDYCVKFTVLDALQLGYQVDLKLEGCRGVELKDGDVQRAIDEMHKAGARIEPSSFS